MAATTPKRESNVTVLRPSRAPKGAQRAKSRKHLPTLTSAEIEEIFNSADARQKNWKDAA